MINYKNGGAGMPTPSKAELIANKNWKAPKDEWWQNDLEDWDDTPLTGKKLERDLFNENIDRQGAWIKLNITPHNHQAIDEGKYDEEFTREEKNSLYAEWLKQQPVQTEDRRKYAEKRYNKWLAKQQKKGTPPPSPAP